ALERAEDAAGDREAQGARLPGHPVRRRDDPGDLLRAAKGGRAEGHAGLRGRHHRPRRRHDLQHRLQPVHAVPLAVRSDVGADPDGRRRRHGAGAPRRRLKGRGTKDKRMIPLWWYLGLSALLFTIGAVGVFIKRNAITIFLCIELMLNAVNLSLVAMSSYFGDIGGQLFVFIVMTVAAAEAAVGLAIIISIFRNRESLNVDEADTLKL